MYINALHYLIKYMGGMNDIQNAGSNCENLHYTSKHYHQNGKNSSAYKPFTQ